MADTTPTPGATAAPNLATAHRHTITLGHATTARVAAERTARRVILELMTAGTGPTWQFVQTLNVATARELGALLLSLAALAEGGAA